MSATDANNNALFFDVQQKMVIKLSKKILIISLDYLNYLMKVLLIVVIMLSE